MTQIKYYGMSVDDISSSPKGKGSSDAKQAARSCVYIFIVFVLCDSGFRV